MKVGYAVSPRRAREQHLSDASANNLANGAFSAFSSDRSNFEDMVFGGAVCVLPPSPDADSEVLD